ncbi:septal ring lytic transglycosylase RlpA family protein [Ancylobacter sp. A5.8]|uniref:septal ring lytic transglycosylase RlpA family protein n=1 Tax=Ancylobacter gelatini TaxID=2919920 RepID=UPI001F4E3AC4|nr:septal ring lytic transglycosylase RlpA family protein [Ancylobacter gelatini]MCJ8143053.1 septal ring lytic transglycosylase RlpA family protein [Ancylobacter gelatini]
MTTYRALVRAAGQLPAQVTVGRVGRVAALLGIGLLAANCTGDNKLTSKIDPKYGVSASPRVVAMGDPVPKGGGAYRVGKPYKVAGKTYVPKEMNKGEKFEGLASWYGDDFHGRMTANGEVFDMHSIAAAHPTLPMPSYVRVTNKDNGRSMVVRVNDRGPYHGNRVIDVSQRAADMLGFKSRGTARVKVEYIGPARLEGSDDIQLAATLRTNTPAPEPTVMVASASSSTLMVASNGPITAVRATRTTVIAAANVPLPPSRPFDLGEGMEETVASAAPMAPTYVAPRAKPVAVASAPAPRPVINPASAPRPVQAAALAQPRRTPVEPPPPVIASAPEASGWMVGAQPAMGYAATGVLTPVGTGRGLY